MKCTHVYRSGPLFKGHVLGGASLGCCEREAVSGLVFCVEHALESMREEIATLTYYESQLTMASLTSRSLVGEA